MKINENELAQELYSTVNNWINKTFNFIQLEVIKRTLSVDYECLEYLIEPTKLDYEEYINDYSKEDNFNEWLIEKEYDKDDSNINELQEEFCEQDEDFQEYKDNKNDNNYPMWNTIFELRSNWRTVSEKAPEAGFGVINASDYFNDALFVSGAGYSFYAQHWIPLYLSIFQDEAEKYKGIDYSYL